MISRDTCRSEMLEALTAYQLHFLACSMGKDGEDLKIVNIDSSFLMSNYCNIGIFIVVDLESFKKSLWFKSVLQCNMVIDNFNNIHK